MLEIAGVAWVMKLGKRPALNAAALRAVATLCLCANPVCNEIEAENVCKPSLRSPAAEEQVQAKERPQQQTLEDPGECPVQNNKQ